MAAVDKTALPRGASRRESVWTGQTGTRVVPHLTHKQVPACLWDVRADGFPCALLPPDQAGSCLHCNTAPRPSHKRRGHLPWSALTQKTHCSMRERVPGHRQQKRAIISRNRKPPFWELFSRKAPEVQIRGLATGGHECHKQIPWKKLNQSNHTSSCMTLTLSAVSGEV